MNFKYIAACALTVLISTSSLSVFAGEFHYGAGSSRESACSSAEAKARRAAREKDSCYEECDVRACTKDSGEYMCRSSSANHSGSCGKTGKIEP